MRVSEACPIKRLHSLSEEVVGKRLSKARRGGRGLVTEIIYGGSTAENNMVAGVSSRSTSFLPLMWCVVNTKHSNAMYVEVEAGSDAASAPRTLYDVLASLDDSTPSAVVS